MQLIEQYGEDTLEKGGLSIRSTIDTSMQLAAQTALQNGLIAFERNLPIADRSRTSKPVDGAAERLKAFKLPAGMAHGKVRWSRRSAPTTRRSPADRRRDDQAARRRTRLGQPLQGNGNRAGLHVGDVVLVELKREILNAAKPKACPRAAIPIRKASLSMRRRRNR